MKLSRAKINRIATLIADSFKDNSNIEQLESTYNIRLEIIKIITHILEWEESIDKKVREKIISQKRTIHEGTPEWTVLYRNYYLEELQNYGKFRK